MRVEGRFLTLSVYRTEAAHERKFQLAVSFSVRMVEGIHRKKVISKPFTACRLMNNINEPKLCFGSNLLKNSVLKSVENITSYGGAG